MKTLFKAIWWVLAMTTKYIVWPVVKWTAIVASKILLYVMIVLLKAMRDILIFAFNVIFIDSLTLLLKRL